MPTTVPASHDARTLFAPVAGLRAIDGGGADSHDDDPELELVSHERALEDELIGATIDARYEILERLGEGGMGIVYRARHVHLGAEVALKVMRSSLSQVPGAMERLRREAQAASAIGDPHIVDVRDFGRLADGRSYFVMEHLSGRSLDEVLEQGPMPWRQAVAVGRQIAGALCAAHRAGIVHRDLKPENVVLLDDRAGDAVGFVKVLDFGVAKIEHAAAKITAAGQLLGTPHYMSPEQCAGAAGVDHRTDVYSLGMILYECVTGEVAFDDDDLAVLIRRQIHEAPLAPSAAGAALPSALEQVILRCLAKRPEERLQSMREVEEALAAVVAEVPTLVPAPLTPPAARPRRTRTWAYAAGAAVVLGLLVVAGLSFTRRAVEPSSAATPRAAAEATTHRASRASTDRAHDHATADASDGVIEVVSAGMTPIEPSGADVAIERGAVPASIELRTDPAGAAVLADGVLLGVTPVSVPAPSGTALTTLTLRKAGYDTRELRVSAQTGSALTIPLVRTRANRASVEPAPAPAVIAPPPEPAPAIEAPRAPARRTEFLDPWSGREH